MTEAIWKKLCGCTESSKDYYFRCLMVTAVERASEDIVDEIKAGPPSTLQLTEQKAAKWIADRHKRVSVIRRLLFAEEEQNESLILVADQIIEPALETAFNSAVEAIKTQAMVVAAAEQLDDNQQEDES